MSTQNIQQQPITNLLGNFFDIRLHKRGSQRERILKRYMQFVNDPAACVAAVVQEPLKITKNENVIKRFFGEDVHDHIAILNRITAEDQRILHKASAHQNMIMLYLVNFEHVLLHMNLTMAEKSRKFKKKIYFANKVLRVCAAGSIVSNLEDEFFAIMYPRLFEKYSALFDSKRDIYCNIEKTAKKTLKKILCDDHILARVQSRTKSIASIHNKIKKKNILPSQVLDLIGLRVLVRTKEDCYRALEIILSHWSTHHARIKDYIAIPKENGYQSIHVTGEFEGKYVEIQIRTHNMHHKAQYGQASHRVYKRSK